MRTLTKDEAYRAFYALAGRAQCKDPAVSLVRDSWTGGFTTQVSDGVTTCTLTGGEHTVSTIVGSSKV